MEKVTAHPLPMPSVAPSEAPPVSSKNEGSSLKIESTDKSSSRKYSSSSEDNEASFFTDVESTHGETAIPTAIAFSVEVLTEANHNSKGPSAPPLVAARTFSGELRDTQREAFQAAIDARHNLS